jgi:hypothetical protein
MQGFSLLHSVHYGYGVHPASYPMDTVSLGVKRPGREAEHSPPSSAEVKKGAPINSIPPYVFTAWYLIKRSDNGLNILP